jgi:hypothetical protein
MNAIEILLRIAVMGFSFLLFITVSTAYLRVKNTKLLFACMALLLFLVKGIIYALGIFNVYFNNTFPVTSELLLFDFLILLLLYFGLAKK